MRVSSLEHLGHALRERIGKLQESINGGKKKNPLFVVLPALELLWMKLRYRAHWQLKFSFLSRSSKFQAAILFIVVANTTIVILSAVGVIGVEVSSMLNYLFMIIFIVECIIKILGLGFAGYFVDPWNKVKILKLAFGSMGSTWQVWVVMGWYGCIHTRKYPYMWGKLG